MWGGRVRERASLKHTRGSHERAHTHRITHVKAVSAVVGDEDDVYEEDLLFSAVLRV